MTRPWTIGLALGALLAGLVAYGGSTLWSEAATPLDIPRVEKSRHLADAKIAPHKALYRIDMVSKRSSAQVLNISGEMFFEWKPGCEAWSTDHRFNLLYEYADSPPMRITSDFTTYEPFDGETFDFNSRRRRDGELYEELRGQASVTSGAAGQAIYTLPEGLKYDLAPETFFPMAHTVHVLQAAREGKKMVFATIFDGSDDEGPADVTAFIGKPVNALARITTNPTIDTALINTPAWQIRLAFFPLNSSESDSDYEMDVVLHDNGVISDMLVDYKDFSVTQKLVSLEKLPAVSCGTPLAPPDKGQKTRNQDRIKP
jgi:hypothetical protein